MCVGLVQAWVRHAAPLPGLNHEAHEGHEDLRLMRNFVLFVLFVVQQPR